MAIYRCNQCGFVSEDAVSAVGAKVPCPRCGTACTVYGTVFYVEKLVERYMATRRELVALQQADAPVESAATLPPATSNGQALMAEGALNTDALATAAQHQPLQTWLAAKQIQATFDFSSVDTTGFFDDAAKAIGARYDLFGELMERVRFSYRKSFSWLNLELGGLSQKDAQAVNALCRQLYGFTFFSRYTYQKQEKIVRLTLQSAPAVRGFFEGGWLEWYAFVELLALMQARGQGFSCARGVKVTFPNEDLHELDVVFLPQGLPPICIECKSGEFRQDIEKYLKLKRRLGIERSRFIVCALDLTDEQAVGLNSMYDLTFVSLSSLQTHLQTLV
jgi:hypothetical protein